MSDGIYSALSGAIAQQKALDVVANNVANANTTGYRADRVAFREALATATNGSPAPRDLRYVSVSKIQTDVTTGSLRQTHNPLDVAIQGDGFFSVQTSNGERFTRDGSFVRDQEGVIRTGQGLAVMGADGGEVRIPTNTTDLTITADGSVMVGDQRVAQFKLSRFDNPALALNKEGHTLYVANGNQAAQQDTISALAQGHVEASNVNAIAGMNELITVSRSFEAFQRVIQAFRDMDSRTARDVGART